MTTELRIDFPEPARDYQQASFKHLMTPQSQTYPFREAIEKRREILSKT